MALPHWEKRYNEFQNINLSKEASITLLNSWTIHNNVQAILFMEGNIVHLSFIIIGGTEATICVLPDGFRPKANLYVPATNINTNTGTTVFINTSGYVIAQNADLGKIINVNCSFVAT